MEWTTIGTIHGVYAAVVKGTALTSLEGGQIGLLGLSHNRTWVVWDIKAEQVVTAKVKAMRGLLQV